MLLCCYDDTGGGGDGDGGDGSGVLVLKSDGVCEFLVGEEKKKGCWCTSAGRKRREKERTVHTIVCDQPNSPTHCIQSPSPQNPTIPHTSQVPKILMSGNLEID